jgi:hypothetical protein
MEEAMTDPRGEAVRKELIEFLLATKATVERGPGAEYDARVLLLTVEDRCSAGAEYPHAEEWTFDVTEIDELIGLLSATPANAGAVAEGMVLLPRQLPAHLAEAMGAMDGYEPREKEVFPYQRYQDYFDALCEAAATLPEAPQPDEHWRRVEAAVRSLRAGSCDFQLVQEVIGLLTEVPTPPAPQPATPTIDPRIDPVGAWLQYVEKHGLESEEQLAADIKRNAPVAVVVNNNQPGTQHIIETAPHVTLDVGTKLYAAPRSETAPSGTANDFEAWWNSQTPGMKNPASKSACKRGWDARSSGAAKVPEGYVLVREDVRAFLCGSTPLDGKWFGEKRLDGSHPFWWRRYLAPNAPSPDGN